MTELISSEITYNNAPIEVPLHILELKVGVPVMIIRNVLLWVDTRGKSDHNDHPTLSCNALIDSVTSGTLHYVIDGKSC